jgi:glucosamine-6-phosphate deaminase
MPGELRELARGLRLEALHVLERAAAEARIAGAIAELVRERARRGERAVLALAAGATPVGTYRALVGLHERSGCSLANVVGFSLDEFVGLPAGHACSFARFMDEHLYARVDVPPAARHVPRGNAADGELDAECAAYEAAIGGCGGIDLALVGIGENGHIAFNEPGSATDSRTRVVELHESTRASWRPRFAAGEEPPRRAITMGVATIASARRVHLLAFGGPKAAVLARALRGVSDPAVPASLLVGHPGLELWCDAPAAAELAAR